MSSITDTMSERMTVDRAEKITAWVDTYGLAAAAMLRSSHKRVDALLYEPGGVERSQEWTDKFDDELDLAVLLRHVLIDCNGEGLGKITWTSDSTSWVCAPW